MKNSNENKHDNKYIPANLPTIQDKNKNKYKMLINKQKYYFSMSLITPISPSTGQTFQLNTTVEDQVGYIKNIG